MDHLEARLAQTLEAFLRANPQQETLLAEQEARDRQRRLRGERLALKTEAELQRQGLMRLAEDIRRWQGRVDRAKGAGALDLAGRAESHIAALMEQGRARWQTLEELGGRFAAVERELRDLGAASRPAGAASGAQSPESPPRSDGSRGVGLEADWAAFETQQELEELRRKIQG
ncbi:MAG: hercynine metabolism protein [Cyanobacteriota bacterium]|jgi:hercynine metabolism protein